MHFFSFLSHNFTFDVQKLLPVIERLDLSFNEISQVENLDHLSQLTHLDLSHNAIEEVEALHGKLGNVRTLCLASNKLKSLKGLSKLYSIVNLDVSNNCIKEVCILYRNTKYPYFGWRFLKMLELFYL